MASRFLLLQSALLLAGTMEAGAGVGATASLAAQQTKPSSATSVEIDAQVWAPLDSSVANDDIVAMGRSYHPMAVVVTPKGTFAIGPTLKVWGEGIETAKRNGVRATVSNRYSNRQDDTATAFEAGVYQYTTRDRAGKVTNTYTRFEMLLVKSADRWQVLMERQLGPATEREWDALPH